MFLKPVPETHKNDVMIKDKIKKIIEKARNSVKNNAIKKCGTGKFNSMGALSKLLYEVMLIRSGQYEQVI